MHRCVELVREDGQQLCVCVGAQVCGVSPGGWVMATSGGERGQSWL